MPLCAWSVIVFRASRRALPLGVDASRRELRELRDASARELRGWRALRDRSVGGRRSWRQRQHSAATQPTHHPKHCSTGTRSSSSNAQPSRLAESRTVSQKSSSSGRSAIVIGEIGRLTQRVGRPRAGSSVYRPTSGFGRQRQVLLHPRLDVIGDARATTGTAEREYARRWFPAAVLAARQRRHAAPLLTFLAFLRRRAALRPRDWLGEELPSAVARAAGRSQPSGADGATHDCRRGGNEPERLIES